MRAFLTFLTVLWAAAVIICGLIVISARLAGLYWAFDFAGQFQLAALWTLMVSAALLVLTLPFSRKRFVNLFFANLAVIIAALGWYWIWPDGTPKAGENAVTVYQHNIWGNHPRPERTMRGLFASKADIVALIEAEDPVIARFDESLNKRWPYQAHKLLEERRPHRLKLLSRYEILEANIWQPRDSPAMLRARLVLPEGEVTVLVIHFTRPWPFERSNDQVRQLRGLAKAIESIDGPIIMLGDVNSAAWGRISGPLQREYGFRLVSNPRAGTWPARMPIKYDVPSVDWPPALAIPIDLAFCRGAISCSGHEVGGHFGSDHRSATFKVSLDRTDTTAR